MKMISTVTSSIIILLCAVMIPACSLEASDVKIKVQPDVTKHDGVDANVALKEVVHE